MVTSRAAPDSFILLSPLSYSLQRSLTRSLPHSDWQQLRMNMTLTLTSASQVDVFLNGESEMKHQH